MKSIDLELSRQMKHLWEHLERDMDMLREQVEAEVIEQVKEAIREDHENLQADQTKMQKDLKSTALKVDPLIARQEGFSEELTSVKEDYERLVEKMQDLERRGQERETVIAALRRDFEGKHQYLDERITKNTERLALKTEEGRAHAVEKIEEAASQNRASIAKLATSLKAEADAREGLAHVLVKFKDEMKERCGEIEAAMREESALSTERTSSAARARRELEDRLRVSYQEESQSLGRKSKEAREQLARELREQMQVKEEDLNGKIGDVKQEIENLGAACNEEFSFQHSSWARLVDWTAEVDCEQLERDGRVYVEGPVFRASGLNSLQLCLHMEQANAPAVDSASDWQGASRPRRWSCGAFLRAPHAEVNFRLHVAGRDQVFSANFRETPECGSPKIALVDRLSPTVNVRLELLDVVASANMPDTWPPGLSALLRVPDATQTASREVRRLAAMVQSVSKDVKRTEARIAQVSERAFSIRAAMGMTDDEDANTTGHFRAVLNQWMPRRVDDRRLQALSQPKRELEETQVPVYVPPPERGVDEARIRTLAQPKRMAEEGQPLAGRRRAEEAKPSACSMPVMRPSPRADVDAAKSLRLQ